MIIVAEPFALDRMYDPRSKERCDDLCERAQTTYKPLVTGMTPDDYG
jgi:hypothetical protein